MGCLGRRVRAFVSGRRLATTNEKTSMNMLSWLTVAKVTLKSENRLVRWLFVYQVSGQKDKDL